jgi:Cu+-exporting ATPase
MTTIHLHIGGMSCAGCSGAVERVLRKRPDVAEASVNLALETADVVFSNETPDVVGAISAIEKAGYTAAEISDGRDDTAEAEPTAGQGWKVLIAAILSAPFVPHMVVMLSGGGGLLPPWLQWVLATPVLLWFGMRFHTGAVKALSHGAANMDVLVSLGTLVAYIYSLAIWLTTPDGAVSHLYFEASAMIVTFVMFGKWLEERAKRSASAAIRALMNLRPEEALVRRDGQDVSIPVDQVKVGDVIIIKPGARIPVDATVENGASEVDESLITGESIPVAKMHGDTVVAGAVNGAGLLECTATRVGNDTTLGRIVALVAAAQGGKAPIQRLVDRIAAIFVPVVVAIALVSFTVWMLSGSSFDHALAAAVSVLVIACPCAMGLATPAALVAGTGAAARHGILIRDIEALERAAHTDVVAFDKTGTLTEGKPKLVNLYAVDDEDALLRLAASAQQGSEHPLAQGLVNAAKPEDLLPVQDFQAVAGQGIQATVDGHRIVIGTAEFMVSQQVEISDLLDIAAGWQSDGQTVSFVGIDGVAAGLVAFLDTPRPDAKQAVEALKARQVEPLMLSGDHPDTVAAVARELHVADFVGRASPADKANAIKARQEKGHVVAMVGDGLNDAPALAQADVSIAMGSGTDVAMETAGITLMRSDPSLVAAALAVASSTRRNIRQNLFWAFAYNVFGIPLAAFGMLHPAFAGAAMALSSVCVVTNALRLTRWHP